MFTRQRIPFDLLRRENLKRLGQGSLACFFLQGAGWAFAGRRDFNLAGKDELFIAVPCEIQIEQGPKASMQVAAPDEVLEALRLTSSGRVARLDTAKGFTTKQRIVVQVEMPGLVRLETSSAVSAIFGHWKTDKLALVLDGSGKARFNDLSARTIQVVLRGASSMVGSGDVTTQIYSIDGAGSIDARRLIGQSVKVSITGSGDAVVSAKKDLQVDIAGVGNVQYVGQPLIKRQINGVGSVEPL